MPKRILRIRRVYFVLNLAAQRTENIIVHRMHREGLGLPWLAPFIQCIQLQQQQQQHKQTAVEVNRPLTYAHCTLCSLSVYV